MKKMRRCFFVISVVLLMSALPVHSEDDSQICDMASPWIPERLATLILSRDRVLENILRQIDARPSVVELQLLLWAVITDEIEIEVIEEKIEVNSIIKEDHDSLMALLWVIARANLDSENILGLDAYLEELSEWANGMVKENPRKMFLTILSASGVSGKSLITLEELETIDPKIRDPEILFGMAGRKQRIGDYAGAHSLLVEAVDNGLLTALFGLGELEVNAFPQCAERGRKYMKLFSIVWLPE